MSRAVNGWHWLWRGWYVAIITGRRQRLMVKRYRGTFPPYAPELTDAERAFLAEIAKDLPVWTPKDADRLNAEGHPDPKSLDNDHTHEDPHPA